MSEQQADEAAAEPTETGSDSTDDSTGSSDSGGAGESSKSGDSSKDLGPSQPGEISDADLPEDLQPTEDNPLARHPKQTGDEADMIGADTESGDASDPSASMTYGSDDDTDDNGTS